MKARLRMQKAASVIRSLIKEAEVQPVEATVADIQKVWMAAVAAIRDDTKKSLRMAVVIAAAMNMMSMKKTEETAVAGTAEKTSILPGLPHRRAAGPKRKSRK